MSKRIKKYLGIDWGEKRIGLALGNSENKIATPFKVVGSMEEILKIVTNEKINTIVIGQPLKMHDEKEKIQREFLEFLDLLKKRIGLPIETIDERLSSKQADKLEGDKKTKAPQDAVAAMLILQTYLDKT